MVVDFDRLCVHKPLQATCFFLSDRGAKVVGRRKIARYAWFFAKWILLSCLTGIDSGKPAVTRMNNCDS